MPENEKSLYTQLPRFGYRPLERPGLLRLLRLDDVSQGIGREMICTMTVVDRYKPPPGILWTALSYRWGDASDVVPLLVREVEDPTLHHHQLQPESIAQRCIAKVPRSALDMLRSLYDSRYVRDKWVWIDYLCLNQEDDEEKSNQVRLMGEVYALSCETIVFAGPELPSTPLALRFWGTLTEAFAQLKISNGDGRALMPSAQLLSETGTSQGGSEWVALCELLTTPWFGRLWVMQEAVLPQKLVFVWGEHSLRWEELSRYIEWDHRSDLTSLIGRGLSVWTSVSVLKKIGHMRNNRAGASKGWICDLSYALYQCDATTSFDPKDRVYGLLGMLHGNSPSIDIVPDYRKETPPSAVFTDATAKWTAQNDSFDLIYSAGIGRPRNISGLPSWVPDYTLTLAQYPSSHCRAGKGRYPNDLEPLVFEGSEFYVQMYSIDHVKQVLQHNHNMGSDEHAGDLGTDPRVSWYLESAIRLMSTYRPGPWSDEQLELFVRTITHNSVVNSGLDGGESAPDEYISVFSQLEVTERLGIGRSREGCEPVVIATPLQRQRFLATVSGYMDDNNTVCLTERGQCGLVPRLTSVGDTVVVCPGSRVPFLWRSRETERKGAADAYQMVGTGYFHAYNDGIELAASYGTLERAILT